MQRLLTRTSLLPKYSWLTGPSPEAITWKEILTSLFSLGGAEAQESFSDFGEFLSSRFDSSKVFLFGEHHHQPAVLNVEVDFLNKCSSLQSNGKLVLVLEHFNILQNKPLQEYCDYVASDEREQFAALSNAYSDSSEGFRLDFYRPLFQAARAANIRMYGGFPPREWAKVVLREGARALMDKDEVKQTGFDRWQDLRPSSAYKALITSMISGEPPHPADPDDSPIENLKGLAVAQCLKDAFLAFTIDHHLSRGMKVLVVCGSGHVEYGLGVKERIRIAAPTETQTVLVKTASSELWKSSTWGQNLDENLLADAVYFYKEQ